MNNLSKIFKDGVLMQVHVSFWSGARILKPEDLGLRPDQIAETYKLGRKFLIPESVIAEFRHIEGKARNLVDKYSHPFPFGNARFVTWRAYKKVAEQLKELKEQYMVLAEKLVVNYDKYRAEVLPIYQEAAEKAWLTSQPPLIEGSLEGFDQAKQEYTQKFLDRIGSYYPQVQTLRAKFSLIWNEYEIAAPEMRELDEGSRAEREQIIRDARSAMQNKIEGFVTDVVKVLRSETAEICGRIANAVKEGKVIKSTTVDSLRNFIERFKDMNFVGDETISAQLDAVQKELLDAHPAKSFIDNQELREELGRKLTVIAEEATKVTEQDINSVTGDYRRKVNWED
jgi:hypothetical protein